jgi:signal transduction histidine kinase
MIRNRLILAYLLPTVILLAAAGLLVYREARASLEDELGQRLIAVAQTAVGSLPSGEPRRLAKLRGDDESTLARLRDKLIAVRDAAGVRRVFLFDKDRKSLVDTRTDVGFGDVLFELEADQVEMERVFLPPGTAASSVLFSGEDGTRYKNGYAPILHDGEVIAAIGVEGSASFFSIITNFQTVMVGTALLVLLAIVLMSLVVARTITQPIEVLVQASRRFGAGDMETVVQMDRRDEFQTLGNAFNDMRQDVIDRDRQMQMMLSGIAHEVRNPLGGMEIFCGLLAEELEDEPERLDYVVKVRRELKHLDCVVTDFLEYARRRPLEWKRFAATESLTEITQLLAWDLPCALTSSAAPDLELTADKEKLHAVLINLVRNAGQATGESGSVALHAREIEGAQDLPEFEGYDAREILWPTQNESGSWRVVFVTDEGRGIPAEKLAGVFEAFYTTKEKGSGLGLAFARKVVEEHGGGLAAASTEGKGTVMAVILPFKQEIERAKMVVPEGWLG